MGLKNLLNKEGTKLAKLLCLVIGEDKCCVLPKLETTGVYSLDNKNRLAFNSLPFAIGIARLHQNGRVRNLGPLSIYYEPTSRPFSFAELEWTEVEHKEDVILDTAFAEGCSRAIQKEDRQNYFNRLTTILLIATLGAVALAFLAALQSGVLSDMLSGLPKFFGGG